MHSVIDKLCTSYAPPGVGVYAQVMHKILTRYKQVSLCRSCRALSVCRHGNTARTRTKKTSNGTDTQRQEKTHGKQRTRLHAVFVRVCERMESTRTRTRERPATDTPAHQQNGTRKLIVNLFRFFLIKIALS